MRAIILAVVVVALAPAQGFAMGAEKASAAKSEAETTDDAVHVLYEKKPDKAAASIFDFDFGPPKSPALELLGLTPDKTPPANSLKKFVFSTPTLFGGQSGQSVAMDGALGALFEKRGETTFRDYLQSPLTRLKYRSKFSLAALNGDDGGSDASKAVRSRVALGLTVSLLDQSDPIMAGRTAAGPLLLTCLARLSPLAAPILASVDTRTYLSADESKALLALDTIATELSLGGAVTPAMRNKAAPYLEADKTPKPAAAGPVKGPSGVSDQQIDNLIKQLHLPPEDRPVLKQIIMLARGGDTAAAGDHATAESEPAPTLTDEAFKKAVADEVLRLQTKAASVAETGNKKARTDLDEAGVTSGLAACADQASRLAMFSPNLQVGGGALARGDAGRLEHLKRDGRILWAAFKVPLSPTLFAAAVQGKPIDQVPTQAMMGFVSARFGWRETVSTGDKTVSSMLADTRDLWVGTEWITPKYRFTGQYGWNKIEALEPLGKPFERSGEAYLVSGQFQLGDVNSPLWLGLTYGNGYGTGTAPKAHTALVTLTYGSTKPKELSTRD